MSRQLFAEIEDIPDYLECQADAFFTYTGMQQTKNLLLECAAYIKELEQQVRELLPYKEAADKWIANANCTCSSIYSKDKVEHHVCEGHQPK